MLHVHVFTCTVYMYMYLSFHLQNFSFLFFFLFLEEGTTRTDLLSTLDNDDPVARALFKMIDEKVVVYTCTCSTCTVCASGGVSQEQRPNFLLL